MKKIILNTIIISLLSITSIFADNNTNNNKNNNNQTIEASSNATAVITITDLSGKVVYSETFAVDTENGSNIKLNPENKLNKGIYIVIVNINGETLTQKLIVQ